MTTTTKGPGKEKNATSNETKTKVSTTSTKLLYPSTTSNDTGEAPHIMVYDKRSSRGRHTGVVVVVTLVALVGAAILGVFFCKRKKIIKQNAYITFSTPKYRREQLPNNDFNMESPLTLSSNGYTVLA
ncbi:hypothetical protein NP493_143g01022 [Ridgeia piscesae]|uniref:Uncharacterized protein n=1 Tax=Ridgeia piscesae TaxID=27915 RepID=A0AAD9P4R1_RIDPI|nr:hypothetical protein NP493_143g01022 [Ridgeia piscesae]